ncbi:hypothetical protein D9M71_747490 [compost metagenome]
MSVVEYGFQGFNHYAFSVFSIRQGWLDGGVFTGLGQLLTQIQQALGQCFLFHPQGFQLDHFDCICIKAIFQRRQCVVIDLQTGFGVTAQGLTLTAAFSQFATQAL